jgi:hypothetical protein
MSAIQFLRRDIAKTRFITTHDLVNVLSSDLFIAHAHELSGGGGDSPNDPWRQSLADVKPVKESFYLRISYWPI